MAELVAEDLRNVSHDEEEIGEATCLVFVAPVEVVEKAVAIAIASVAGEEQSPLPLPQLLPQSAKPVCECTPRVVGRPSTVLCKRYPQ